MKIRSLCASGLLLALSSCVTPATIQPNSDEPTGCGWITKAGSWPGPGEYRVNLVTFHDQQNNQTHLVRFDVFLTRARLLMIAQSTLGVPLYEIALADGQLRVTRHSDRLRDMSAVLAN